MKLVCGYKLDVIWVTGGLHRRSENRYLYTIIPKSNQKYRNNVMLSKKMGSFRKELKNLKPEAEVMTIKMALW